MNFLQTKKKTNNEAIVSNRIVLSAYRNNQLVYKSVIRFSKDESVCNHYKDLVKSIHEKHNYISSLHEDAFASTKEKFFLDMLEYDELLFWQSLDIALQKNMFEKYSWRLEADVIKPSKVVKVLDVLVKSLNQYK